MSDQEHAEMQKVARMAMATQFLSAHIGNVGVGSVDGYEIEKCVHLADALLSKLAEPETNLEFGDCQ